MDDLAMNTEAHLRPRPEDEELTLKRQECECLESQLIERELYLTELRAEVASFENVYLKVVGTKYAELDEIEAQIAELHARRDLGNSDAQQVAREARARAQESQASTTSLAVSKQERFSASASLKSLYREVAKRIHPDLATDDEDRARRQKFMTEANDAYQAGNEARLRAVLEEYESSPESVHGQGTAADLVRVIRKIAQIKRRLAEIETETKLLMKSEIMELKSRVDADSKRGLDLLEQMAAVVSRRIEEARSTLSRICKGEPNV